MRSVFRLVVVVFAVCWCNHAHSQMGGAPPGGGAPALEKPKFYERVLEEGGPRLQADDTGKLVVDVRIEGLRVVPEDRVFSRLQTRVDRNFSRETVMEDVRRLYSMEYFDQVQHRIEERPDGFSVTYIVRERALISEVIFFGNRAMNERELKGHAGLEPGSPLNDQSIESARRRLVDFYLESGFGDVVVEAQKGLPSSPRAVVFRINEGELMRVREVRVLGSQFIEEARLKKIVSARGGLFGIPRYWGNVASQQLFDEDVQRLKLYYRNLGFFEAQANRLVSYDESGKWVTVHYVVNEGQRYFVTDVQIVGTKFITAESLAARLKLQAGQPFDRGKMDVDIRQLRDAYGSEGFFFADVQAQPTFLEKPGELAMVYKIQEGDRCKCGEIRVHIDGDTLHTRMGPIMNRLDGIRPGELLDRRSVEQAERRLKASGLFTTNPAEGEPPRIEVATPSLSELESSY